MKTNNIFNIRRLLLLLRRQIFSNGKSILIAIVGVAGFLLFITLLVAYFNQAALPGLTNLYFTVMFVGGYVFTSNIYAELHPIQRSYSYLTLPVSVTERLLSGWIITGILFPVFSVIAMALIVFVANLVMNLTVDMTPVQSVFSIGSLNAVKVYFITQTIFLLGAAYFRKNNFLKTLLALFLFILVIMLYSSLLGYTLFHSFGNIEVFNGEYQDISMEMEDFFTIQFPKISRFIFHWLLWPFFLVTTWFCLKERQV